MYPSSFWILVYTNWECYHLLGYKAAYSAYEPTFRRNVSPPPSGSKISRTWNQRVAPSHLQHSGFFVSWFSNLKTEVIRSSETSAHIRTTRHYIPKIIRTYLTFSVWRQLRKTCKFRNICFNIPVSNDLMYFPILRIVYDFVKRNLGTKNYLILLLTLTGITLTLLIKMYMIYRHAIRELLTCHFNSRNPLRTSPRAEWQYRITVMPEAYRFSFHLCDVRSTEILATYPPPSMRPLDNYEHFPRSIASCNYPPPPSSHIGYT
jgi:hypothetical protein